MAVCKFFAAGICRFGSECRNLHEAAADGGGWGGRGWVTPVQPSRVRLARVPSVADNLSSKFEWRLGEPDCSTTAFYSSDSDWEAGQEDVEPPCSLALVTCPVCSASRLSTELSNPCLHCSKTGEEPQAREGLVQNKMSKNKRKKHKKKKVFEIKADAPIFKYSCSDTPEGVKVYRTKESQNSGSSSAESKSDKSSEQEEIEGTLCHNSSPDQPSVQENLIPKKSFKKIGKAKMKSKSTIQCSSGTVNPVNISSPTARSRTQHTFNSFAYFVLLSRLLVSFSAMLTFLLWDGLQFAISRTFRLMCSGFSLVQYVGWRLLSSLKQVVSAHLSPKRSSHDGKDRMSIVTKLLAEVNRDLQDWGDRQLSKRRRVTKSSIKTFLCKYFDCNKDYLSGRYGSDTVSDARVNLLKSLSGKICNDLLVNVTDED